MTSIVTLVFEPAETRPFAGLTTTPGHGFGSTIFTKKNKKEFFFSLKITIKELLLDNKDDLFLH